MEKNEDKIENKAPIEQPQGAPLNQKEGVEVLTSPKEKEAENDENPTKADKKYLFKGGETVIERKEKFLVFYRKTLGSIKDTCDMAGIVRDTYYDWRDKDPEFMKAIKDAFVEKMEDVERQLNKLMIKEDGPSVRYWLDRRHPEFMPKMTTEIKSTGDTFTEDIKRIKQTLKNGDTTTTTIKSTTTRTNEPGLDSALPTNQKQAGGTSTVSVKPGATVLLEKKDTPKPNNQSTTKGNK
jgi:hypothetical protein